LKRSKLIANYNIFGDYAPYNDDCLQAQAIMSCRTLQDADKKTQIRDLLKKLRESIISGAASGGGAPGAVEGEIHTDASPRIPGSESLASLISIDTANTTPVNTEEPVQPPPAKDK
jgi:hypothetical protein